MGRSRTAVLLGTLVVLGLLVWGLLTLVRDDGPGTGVGSLVTAGTEAASRDVPLPRGEEAQPLPEGEAAAPDPTGEATELELLGPDYPRHRVRGRVLIDDGGPVPEGLELSATSWEPKPALHSFSDIGSDSFHSLAALTPEQLERRTRIPVAADGAFAMEQVPDNGAWVRAHDAHLFVHPPVILVALRQPEGAAEGPEVLVHLVRGGLLHGRVTDPDERPVAEAELQARSPFDPFSVLDNASLFVESAETTSDAEGRWRLEQVPAGIELLLDVRAEGFERARQPVPSLVPGTSTAVDVVLLPGARLAGVVVTLDGAPVAAAEVHLMPTTLSVGGAGGIDEGHSGQETTGADGAFLFDSVPAGKYELVLGARGWRQAKLPLEVATGESRDDLRLIAEEGLWVEGRVTDAQGQPVADARVHGFVPPKLMSWSDSNDRRFRPSEPTDEAGTFRLGGFDPGDVRLRASKSGHVDAQQDVAAGSRDVVLVLEKTSTIAGIVVSLGDGEPVQDFRVSLLPPGGMFSMADMWGIEERFARARKGIPFHSEDGTFLVDEVLPGEYELHVDAAGFGTEVLPGVDVAPAADVKGLVVLLPPAARIVGSIVAARDGAPVAGAAVGLGSGGIIDNLNASMSGTGRRLLTDAQGTFALEDLPEGELTLSITHSDFLTLAVPVTRLRQGETRDVGTLSLSQGGAVWGHVYDARGLGQAGVTVMASNNLGTTVKRSSTDAQGLYRITGLPAGGFSVMRMDFTMEMDQENPNAFLEGIAWQMITLGKDEEQRVDLRPAGSKEGTALFGVVSDAAGPVPGAMVSLVPSEGGMPQDMSFTDDDGQYRLEGVAPGRYVTMVVSVEGSNAGSGALPSSSGHEQLSVGAAAEQRHDIRLPGAALSGAVSSRDSGAALPDVRVLLEREPSELPSAPYLAALGGRVGEAYTDAGGSFAFRHLAPGRYTLVVGGVNLLGMGDPDWAITRIEDIEIAGEGPTFPIKVRLEAAGSIAGRVRDAAGSPIAGVSVWARHGKSGAWTATLSEIASDAAGRFSVPGLEQGTWSLALADGVHGLTLVPEVQVRTGEATPLEISLADGVALLVDLGPWSPSQLTVAVAGAGEILPTELASLNELGQSFAPGSTWKVAVLAPGSYQITVSTAGQVLVDESVTFAPGAGSVTLELAAP